MSPLPGRALRALAAASAASAVAASAAVAAPQGGTDLDLRVVGGTLFQSIQDGATPLVAAKTTLVRVRVVVSGTIPPGAEYDGVMRVFVGGVEVPESPVYSSNGPLPVGAFGPGELDATLNFTFLPPASDDVTLEYEINLPGPNQLAEIDYSNNVSTQGPLDFACKQRLEIAYVPIDYRPNGELTPNLPDPELIRPGIGDGFVQGIYPVPDLDYRIYDAGSKLWTSSLAGSGSALNNEMTAEWQLMNPKPDYIYSWVPGGLPYNGQSIINGVASMGNTQEIRFQRTFAHEVGHNTGLLHNGSNTNVVGIDVEHHLIDTESLPQVKDPGLKDIMVGGQLTPAAWVAPFNWAHFYNHPTFQCGHASALPTDGELLMLSGILDREARTVDLDAGLVFEGGQPTQTVPVSQADLVLRLALADGTTAEFGLPVRTSADCEACRAESPESESDSQFEDPLAGFVAVLPASVYPASVQRVAVVDPQSGQTIASLARSANAPELSILAPRPSLVLGGPVTVEWEASDADGDALSYTVRYSPDGETVIPLAVGTTETSLDVDLDALPQLVSGAAWLEVLATDGLRTSRRVSLALGTGAIGGGVGNAPDAYVVTPNEGAVYPRGATVVLHGAAWDLEDRSLDGTDTLWTSDLDGAVANGRRATATDLSVGTHVLTFTATDTGGLQDSESVTITIVDRPLPGEVLCQSSLGFAGPGSVTLALCGGDLSTGTTADLALAGAPANAPLWIGVGLASNPTPLLGGTVVPVPAAALVPGVANGSGAYTNAGFPGGGGPGSLFLQAIVLDGAQFEGFAISNALQVDLLP